MTGRARRAWEPGDVSTQPESASADELFQRARTGSPDAWEQLYLVARPQLFRFARVRLATDDQAEDAVSETFARAIAAADRYRPGAGVLAWLVGICRNVVNEAYRAGGRVRSIDPAHLTERTTAAPEAGPADHAVARDEASSLRAAFARLSDEEQELLALRVVAGLDGDAVAAVIGKKAGAVRMAQSRALTRLRVYLEEAT